MRRLARDRITHILLLAAWCAVVLLLAFRHAFWRDEVRAFNIALAGDGVPGMLRGPLDETSKKEFGYSVSEMLDAKSPVGAALSTLNRLQAGDRRAILLIDESRAR